MATVRRPQGPPSVNEVRHRAERMPVDASWQAKMRAAATGLAAGPNPAATARAGGYCHNPFAHPNRSEAVDRYCQHLQQQLHSEQGPRGLRRRENRDTVLPHRAGAGAGPVLFANSPEA